MKNIDKIRVMSAEELAKNLLPPHCECEYCIINAECNHICGNCYENIAEWLNQESNPMPKVEVGDVLQIKFSNSNKEHTATVVGDGYMYSSDSGYGLTEISDSHYKIVEVWRFNGKCLKTIWRADND